MQNVPVKDVLRVSMIMYLFKYIYFLYYMLTCKPVYLHTHTQYECRIHILLIALQAAKICNNMLLAIGMIGTAETMNLGIRYFQPSRA